VKQDVEQASSYFSAGCARCLLLNPRDDQTEAGTANDEQLKKAMRSILDTTGKVKTLEEAIVATAPNHEDIKLVRHARSKAFALAALPDYMGDALDCAARAPGEPVSFKSTAGGKNYGKYYAMGFRMAKAGEDSGVLWAVWAQDGPAWRLTSYTVLTP